MQRFDFQVDGLSAEYTRRSRVSRWSGAAAGIVAVVVYVADPPGQIQITPPSSLTTTDRHIMLTGKVASPRINAVLLNRNGVLQTAVVTNGSFTAKVPLTPGENIIGAMPVGVVPNPAVMTPGENTIQAMPVGIFSSLMGTSNVVKIQADIKPADIWTQLVWDGPGDIDLHLHLPNGEHCYYEKLSTPSGATLDFDNTVERGPEHIVMERAISGAYRLSVVYFAGNPPRDVAWTVTVQLKNNEPQSFSGTLSKVNDEKDVTRFSFGEDGTPVMGPTTQSNGGLL